MNEQGAALDLPRMIGAHTEEPPTAWPEPAMRMAGLRERKHKIRVAALTVAAASMVLLVGFAAWRLYADWRLGWIVLTTDGPPLTAQVLPETGDEPVGEPFYVLTRWTLALPAGDYRLRVHGMGRLGRTYRFAVNRGETQTHALALDEGLLLGAEPVPPANNGKKIRAEPISYAPVTVAMELTPGKADLIEWTGQAVIRRDGRTGRPVWDSSRSTIPWKIDEGSGTRVRERLDSRRMPQIVQPAPDLDGDGTGDLVWFLRLNTSLLAISGQNGAVLWDYTAELEDDRPNSANDLGSNGPIGPARRHFSLVGAPNVADLDRDGMPDLLATMICFELPAETDRRLQATAGTGRRSGGIAAPRARRMIRAISGQTGRVLWTYPIDQTFAQPSSPVWNQVATLGARQKSATVAYVDRTQWIGLDPATGKPRGAPISLGFQADRPVKYMDLDHDGEPEVLGLRPAPGGPDKHSLAVSSLVARKNLWSTTLTQDTRFNRTRGYNWVDARYNRNFDQTPGADWPLMVDLDGDGRTELVFADSGTMPPAGVYRGLRVVDGITGQTRWIRPMRPEADGRDGLLQVLDAPDIDHDGVRDLITTSFFLGRYLTTVNNGSSTVPERAYVEALSGKDGRPLWWWHHDHPTDRLLRIWQVRQWGRGPDGWPLLAVPIGGGDPEWGFSDLDVPPIVQNLELSTGRAVSTVVGLSKVGAADLDGDGLADLWGEVDGQLRAFRGETPVAWRALGGFGGGREYSRPGTDLVNPAPDLDGDGIADTLIANVSTAEPSHADAITSNALGPFLDQGFPSTGHSPAGRTGSRVAIARSGHDGNVIWTAQLDSERSWLARDHGESYYLTTQPLPAGDLDGDGTPDVFVRKSPRQPEPLEIKWTATLPLDVLSGRSGRLLWSSGPLPLGFAAYGYSSIKWTEACVVEPGGRPDVFVRHTHGFAPPRPSKAAARSPDMPRLARVSGRDGRILWDIPLSKYQDAFMAGGFPVRAFDDLNGDGSLDVVIALMGERGSGRPNDELRAVSLRDGSLLWSLGLDFLSAPNTIPQLAVGDLDGDRRPEVLVAEQASAEEPKPFVLTAIDGRDGTVRWTWNGSASENPQEPVFGRYLLANFGDKSWCTVCVCGTDPKGPRRMIVLDQDGQERISRALPESVENVTAADVNGDGRDELVVHYGGALHIWNRELKELWSTALQAKMTAQVLPASRGQAGAIIVPAAIGLDGSDGHPRWSAGAGPRTWPPLFPASLFDAGDSSRLPRFLTTSGGATVCRLALPTTPNGIYAPTQGLPVKPGLARDDPRWARALPWTVVVRRDTVEVCLLGIVALALFNVFLPLSILRVVARRRPWTMKLMMLLPVAAAVPMSAFVVLEPMIPSLPAPYPASLKVLFTLETLAGIPIVSFAAMAVSSLVRRRWLRLAVLAGLTVLASLGVGLAWLWIDSRSMPAIEHYTWSGWYLAVVPGAYAVGVLMLTASAMGGIVRWLRRLGSRTRAARARVD